MKLLFKIIITFSCLYCPSNTFAAISADDFLPPIQASPKQQQILQQVDKPERVNPKDVGIGNEPAISASTAQDAINTWIQGNADGACQFKFGSGLGWVATGTSLYALHANPVASQIAQRNAYMIAYMIAKKNLAQSLFGLSTTGKEELKNILSVFITDKDSAVNMDINFNESIEESLQAILRGYVVYSVNSTQKQETGKVSVTIVTTPKTLLKFNRPDLNSISSASIREGLNSALLELEKGLVPPVGGKIITVPQTGEIAFVGFGTSVVLQNSNPTLQAKGELTAQKNAGMRARSALCGIILGDNLSAISSVDSQTAEMMHQYDEIKLEDPISKQQSSTYNKPDQERHQFLNTELSKEQISSMRSGILPPGVSVKTFMNEDKTFAQAVAVYIPSVTRQAISVGADMQNDPIIPNEEQKSEFSPKKIQPIKQGPSGQVSNPNDL